LTRLISNVSGIQPSKYTGAAVAKMLLLQTSLMYINSGRMGQKLNM